MDSDYNRATDTGPHDVAKTAIRRMTGVGSDDCFPDAFGKFEQVRVSLLYRWQHPC